MRKTLLLAAAMVAVTTTAYAHDVKDNPLRDESNTTIGTSTPIIKEDADGQIGLNFASTWPVIKLRAQVAAQAIGGNLPLGMAPNADLAAKQ